MDHATNAYLYISIVSNTLGPAVRHDPYCCWRYATENEEIKKKEN